MFIQNIRQTHSCSKEIRVYSQIEQKVEMQDKLVPLRARDQSRPQSTFPLLLAGLEGWAAEGQQLSVCLSQRTAPSFSDRHCLPRWHLPPQRCSRMATHLSPSRDKYLPMLMLSCNAH